MALDEECVALEAIYGDSFSRVSDDRLRMVIEPLEVGRPRLLRDV